MVVSLHHCLHQVIGLRVILSYTGGRQNGNSEFNIPLLDCTTHTWASAGLGHSGPCTLLPSYPIKSAARHSLLKGCIVRLCLSTVGLFIHQRCAKKHAFLLTGDWKARWATVSVNPVGDGLPAFFLVVSRSRRPSVWRYMRDIGEEKTLRFYWKLCGSHPACWLLGRRCG